MPSFKVLFKGVEMIKNHCSGIYSTAIELFIATKAMLTFNCVSVRYYRGPHLELVPTNGDGRHFVCLHMLQPRVFDSRSWSEISKKNVIYFFTNL